MALEEYKRKRNFKQTPEPGGKKAKAKAKGRSYVIQKHAATRLHYDFRLELDGVLLSWAVPKGPSLDPGEERLAVHVEDHPLDYGGFEGVIPEGQYGGGTVLLWDRGSWTPEGDDPVEAYRKGALKFRLDGKKLHGHWALVRMGGKAANERHENWLLIKERDADAVPDSGNALVADNPLSVTTGRSMETIASDRERVWDSKKGEAAGDAKPKPAKRRAGGRRHDEFCRSAGPDRHGHDRRSRVLRLRSALSRRLRFHRPCAGAAQGGARRDRAARWVGHGPLQRSPGRTRPGFLPSGLQ